MARFQFATEDMIPHEWAMTAKQQSEWVALFAPPGADPASFDRLVTVELPDVPLSWEYQRALSHAARRIDDILPPVITSWEQWQGREKQAQEIIERLNADIPPDVIFVALAVPKS